MKIQFQVNPLSLFRLGVFFIAGTTYVMADAQTTTKEVPLELPEIVTGFDLKLENIFKQTDDGPNPSMPDRAFPQPLQLVGTLIMAQNRIAWIKTDQSQIHMLEENQPVPGSKLRILYIHRDSVELVNAGRCIKNNTCYPDLRLELN